MSKKYKITIDGKTHIVEVEDYEGFDAAKDSESIKEVIEKKVVSEVKETNQTTVSSNENSIKAPLQGTLQEIKVNVGQNVKEGEVLVIIEAMKMENEIVASKSGKVVAIHQKNGAKVNTNDPLIDIM